MTNRPYNKEIALAVRWYLTHHNYQYRYEEDKGVIFFHRTLTGVIHYMDYAICILPDGYTITGILPFHAPLKDTRKMQRIDELLGRINYMVFNGCLEMDHKDGEMRYRVYVDCAGGLVPTDKVILNSIMAIDSAAVRFGQALTRVLFQDSDRPVKELLDESEHTFRMHLLEAALRLAAGTRTPLDQTMEWLSRREGTDTSDTNAVGE